MKCRRKLRGRFPVVSGTQTMTGTFSDTVDNLVDFAQGIKTLAASTMLGSLTIGVNDTGHDLKVFGATSGKYWLWDESADKMIVIGDSQFTGAVTVGVDDTGHDVQMFGAAASAYWLWDESDNAMLLAGDARIDLSSCTVAAANTDGGVIKAGTSVAPVTEDTADMKFISLYFDNGATSGDNRGIYNRLYLTGAGGGGESLRTFTTISDVAAGTAHGIHASLSFGSTGSITGLGVAARNTLHVPDAALSGGTYAALQPEIWSDGSSSDISGATEYSFIRVSNGGDATGVANVDDNAFLLALTGGSVASGNVMQAKSSAAVTHVLRMKGPDGNTYYIMVSDAV